MSYSSVVLADSPVAAWRLGEPSGTTADNAEGTAARDGTYTGGYTLGQPGGLPGDSGLSVQLDGSTGYVTVPDNAALDVADVGTYEIWLKRNAATAGFATLIGKGAGALILELSAAGVPYFYVNQSALVVHGSGAISDTTTWHHVVGTKNGATTKLYVDGADVTVVDGTATGAANASALQIGQDAYSSLHQFDGWLEWAAVYPTALSSTRVAAHYAAGNNASGSATITGGGVSVVARVAGRRSAVTATAGGVAAVAIRSARIVAAAATASGVATVARVAGRRSSPASVGGGVAVVAQRTARTTSGTASGGGVLTVVGIATTVPATIAPTDTGAGGSGRRLPHGAARVVGPALGRIRRPLIEMHSVSVHVTGGGVATVVGRAGGGYDDEMILEWLLLEAA